MPLTAPAAQTETQKFVARLRQSLADGSFVKLGLGRPHGSDPTLLKLLARRVVIKGQPQLSLVWRHRTKDITKNLPTEAAVHLVDSLLGDAAEAGFHHAHLQTTGHDIQLARGRKGQWGLRIGRLAAAALPAAVAANAASASTTSAAAADDASAADPPEADADGRYLGHDRARRHPLSLTLPFLAELGITDAQQRLVPTMARKWRQINKFVEVLAHAIASRRWRSATRRSRCGCWISAPARATSPSRCMNTCAPAAACPTSPAWNCAASWPPCATRPWRAWACRACASTPATCAATRPAPPTS
jgi:hypothetical protein